MMLEEWLRIRSEDAHKMRYSIIDKLLRRKSVIEEVDSRNLCYLCFLLGAYCLARWILLSCVLGIYRSSCLQLMRAGRNLSFQPLPSRKRGFSRASEGLWQHLESSFNCFLLLLPSASN
jgi:hypothetical protein